MGDSEAATLLGRTHQLWTSMTNRMAVPEGSQEEGENVKLEELRKMRRRRTQAEKLRA